MKKVFVLYICFCLLSPYGLFASEENVPAIDTIESVPSDKISEKTVDAIKKEDINEGTKSTDKPKSDIVPQDIKNTKDIKIDKSIDEKTEEKFSNSTDCENSKEKKCIFKDILKDTHKKENKSKKEILQNDEEEVQSFSNNVRINEVLPNPDGTDSGHEFIELYNSGDKDVSLEDWHLYDKSLKNKPSKHYVFDDVVLKAKDFLVLYNKKDFKFSLNNSDEEIYLMSPDDEIKSKYSYTTSTSGKSWNYDTKDWYEELPTPNEKNAQNPLTKNYPQILLNELLSNPIGDENTDEFIELYNPTKETVNLQNWILKDASKGKGFLFGDVEIKPGKYLVIWRKDFGFALNNSGDETVSLIAPNNKTVSTISYHGTKEGLSYNRDKNWYWETPTPNEKNTQNPLTKVYPQILLNELLPNPVGDENTDEFIELYNPTNKVVSLKDWQIRDASKSGVFKFSTELIAPMGYLVVWRKDFGFALNNSGDETVSLITPNNKTLSSLTYSQTQEGLSLNRANKWYFAQPSPNKKNFENPKTKSYPNLILSELLPNPSGDEKNREFIEIYNPNKTEISLKYWTLRNASKTGAFTFSTDIVIKPYSYFVIYRKDFNFALNNSNETVYLIAPNEKVTSSVSYTQSAKEDVSYNFEQDTNKWRWSKHLTPNKRNVFNNLPQITKVDIDKKAYKDVYVDFEAKATDIDGEKLNVRWDFGDGHRSYKWNTKHKYTKRGIFGVQLRIQDGSEEIIKNYTVHVKKYPKYDVVITKIFPNPSGKDTGNEYIVIKNESKKDLNLKGWSIATGTSKKTLVNHSIYDDLKIKSGKTKIIKHKHTAITLPNKKGTVELRRPNGSVSDKLKYGDANTSIPDNAFYEKIDNVWQWTIPQDLEEQAQTNEIVQQALKNEQLFAKQKLESLVAYNAIHNPPQDTSLSQDLSLQNNQSLIQKIAKYINKLINKTILVINNVQNKNSKKTLANFTIYEVPNTSNPCQMPSLYNSDKLHFCK